MRYQAIRKETLEALREKYPAGCRVELISMNDPFTSLEAGEQGTVIHVDAIGTIHVNWDCGSSLGIVYREDACRRIK